VEFAQRFDPQPFHVDPEAAKASPFGGLIASGWHTTALFMGMFVRAILLGSACPRLTGRRRDPVEGAGAAGRHALGTLHDH